MSHSLINIDNRASITSFGKGVVKDEATNLSTEVECFSRRSIREIFAVFDSCAMAKLVCFVFQYHFVFNGGAFHDGFCCLPHALLLCLKFCDSLIQINRAMNVFFEYWSFQHWTFTLHSHNSRVSGCKQLRSAIAKMIDVKSRTSVLQIPRQNLDVNPVNACGVPFSWIFLVVPQARGLDPRYDE